MNQLQQHIIKTLAYFDLFNYPLKGEEIGRFLAKKEDQNNIDVAIVAMLQEQLIFKVGDFFSLHNNMELAERRRKGNSLAEKEILNAIKAAKWLSRFPFVKGLAVSGSLSKNFCTEKTDIDFFIITTANKLWIARTCMHLYKKISFFRGKQNWFCMNYYIDEAELEIEEKNIFTAIEVATLLPMQGRTTLHHFHSGNDWVRNYLPANEISFDKVPEIKKGIFIKCFERLCNTRLGNWFDDQLMHITKKRWQRKATNKLVNDHGFLLGMMVNKHYSKPDPKNFQRQVLERYNEKVEKLLGYKKSMAVNTDFAA